jgi:hypothetical protein
VLFELDLRLPEDLFAAGLREDFFEADFRELLEDFFEVERLDDFFEDDFFDEDFFDEDFFEGTLPPSLRASDRPMAIACSRLFTFFPEPDFSVPFFRRRIALSTLSCAFFPYLLAMKNLLHSEMCKWHAALRASQEIETESESIAIGRW